MTERHPTEANRVVRNAGRCDWCGKIISMADGDTLVIAAEEDFGNEEHDVSPQEAADAIADALERAGGPKDAMLADIIREELGYRLHNRCYEETAYSMLPRGEASE